MKKPSRPQQANQPQPPRKQNKNPFTRSSTTAAMDFLARRNHSEKELRQKLLRKYDETEVQKALDYVKEQKWLIEPEALSEQTMNALHRRKKGFLFIQRYLRQKGLPVPSKNLEIEEDKARELLARKFVSLKEFAVKQKAHRFLRSRGFEEDVIRKVIYANDRS
jgi:regulatory protein